MYQPEFKIKLNGWTLNKQVNLGRSNKFTNYDEITGIFSCIAENVEEVDIGKHSILITALFERNNEILVIEKSFNIIVYKSDFKGPDGPDGPTPPNPVDQLPVWGDGIRSNLRPEIKDES